MKCSECRICIFLFAVFCPFILLGIAHGQYIDGYTVICATDHDQILPFVVSDGTGGGIVAWMDKRNGNFDIYAQRVSPSGYALWAENGIPICTRSGEQRWREYTTLTFYPYIPRMISDDVGGAIMVWEEVSGSNISIQRVDGNGNTMWAENGTPVVNAAYWQEYPGIAPNGASGAFVTWQDVRDYSYWRIYAQHFDANGTAQWTENGIPVVTTDASQYYATVAEDGSGGAVIAWQIHIGGTWDIHAQRLDEHGARLWGDAGVAVCSDTSWQERPTIIRDGVGGFVVVWMDNQSGYRVIYAQRLDQDGNTLWADDGVCVCGAGSSAAYPCVVSDRAGNTIITWRGYAAISDKIFTQMIDLNGNIMWGTYCNVMAVNSSDAILQYDQAMIPDGEGGAIIVMNQDWDRIFGQRMSNAGVRLWSSTGAPIWSEYTGTRGPAALAPVPTGGAIVVWQDFREHAGSLYYNDIVVARVDVDGNTVASLLSTFSHEIDADRIKIAWETTTRIDPAEIAVAKRITTETSFSSARPEIVSGDGLHFEFTDFDCEPGAEYIYRISSKNKDGYQTLFETDPIPVPVCALMLEQNFPNPFNPSTTISYYLPSAGKVTIEIFDVSGKKIATLEDSIVERGRHSMEWDGRDNAGRSAKSNIYFCRLSFKKQAITKKIMLVR